MGVGWPHCNNRFRLLKAWILGLASVLLKNYSLVLTVPSFTEYVIKAG
jgi:hypothetical protein